MRLDKLKLSLLLACSQNAEFWWTPTKQSEFWIFINIHFTKVNFYECTHLCNPIAAALLFFYISIVKGTFVY